MPGGDGDDGMTVGESGGGPSTGGQDAGFPTGGMDAGTGGGIGTGGATTGGQPGTGGDLGTGGSVEPPPDNACQALDPTLTPPYSPVYRVELRVHTTRSDLDDETLCGVLEEMNEIWWSQAGICFEIHTVDHDDIMDTGYDLWFERDTPFPNGVTANGVYAGRHEIYTLDNPSLGSAPNPGTYRAARTAAHEMGHGFGLGHQNPGGGCALGGDACDDLLMRSGRRGFQIAAGSPAGTNEQEDARGIAALRALEDMSPTVCGPPLLHVE